MINRKLTQGIDVSFLNVVEVDRPRVYRALGVSLAWDKYVDSLGKAHKGLLRSVAIRLLRLYRWARPKSVGDRCAFEPSCSRYSELAFRHEKSFLGAVRLTIGRLRRCSGEAGGLDLSELELPENVFEEVENGGIQN